MYNLEKIENAAENHAEDLRRTLIQNRQVASGRTLAQIKPIAFRYGYIIKAPYHVLTLQWGRGPSRGGGGGDDVYNNILQWVMDKGIIFQDGIVNSQYTIEERTAKTITYFIHKRGTLLYQTGFTYEGVNDPLGEVFGSARIRQAINEVSGDAKATIRNEVFKTLKDLT